MGRTRFGRSLLGVLGCWGVFCVGGGFVGVVLPLSSPFCMVEYTADLVQ